MPFKSLLSHFPIRFWIPSGIVILLFLAGLAAPVNFSAQVGALNKAIFANFGSFYLWFSFLTLGVFLLIGISPLGNIRLGGAGTKPTYSLFSWFAMLFCAGMGTGMMFWGATEPLYHFMNPPLIGANTDIQREILAFHYTFFHWGLTPWAIYGMTGLAISFFGFNLNKGLTFSSFFIAPHEQSRFKRGLRLTIDLFTLLAIIFGIAASFGMGVLQLEGGVVSLFHLAPGIWLRIGLIILMTVAYTAASISGMDKGIKLVSDFSIWVYLLLLGYVAVVAARPEMIQPLLALAKSIPMFFAHIPAMSLGWGTFKDPGWVREWTVKYWSWWIAWAPFVGIFIAYISKGRTVRELVFASTILPTLFCGVWFTVFGQTAITLQTTQGLVENHLDLQHANLVLFHLLAVITKTPFLPWLCLFTIALDFINSADSATYTVASLSSKNMEKEPSKVLQLGWGLVFACLTSLFLFTGGIEILQQETLITALPFTFLLVIVFLWLLPAMVQYWWRERQAEQLDPLLNLSCPTEEPASLP